MGLRTVHSVAELRAAVTAWRAAGDTVALIPTMGALHAGHLSLVALGRERCRRTVATVFVNPKQFGPNEDFGRYPRTLPQDAAMLDEAGCDLLFAPAVEEVYPPGFATTVTVAALGDGLCGAARPGHFDGVATVVAKLLIMAGPDAAVFGEKDWQQLAIIRRVVADLNLPVEVVGAPIVRDADGLALSSRNRYLSAAERAAATALPRALRDAARAIIGGVPVASALAQAAGALAAAGFATDYLELRAGDDLRPLAEPAPGARLFAAARLGATRLIDNMDLMEAAAA